MKNVLVTGGCGLIGQHICSGLLKKGFSVIATDKEEGMYNTGKLNYSFIQCSVTDKNAYSEICRFVSVSLRPTPLAFAVVHLIFERSPGVFFFSFPFFVGFSKINSLAFDALSIGFIMGGSSS